MKRIVLLLLCLLLVLALAACGKAKEADNGAQMENNALVSGEEMPLTQAGTLDYSNGQVTCRFRKDEDGWKWVDNEKFPLDAAYVEEILTALEEMSAALTPVTPAVDPAECGLDETSRYLTVVVGEEATTLRFGQQREDGQWYMSVDGREDVYLVADEFMQKLDRGIYDMAVLPVLPELTDENLTAIAVRRDSESKAVRLAKKENGWVLGGVTRPDGIADIEAALAEFAFDSCFNYDPSPDAAPLCGLDTPDTVIELSYVNTVGTETTITLTLGTLREDGCYYATLNDDTTVYLLNKDKVAPLLALL